MARGNSTKLKPFQKLLMIMASGNPVTIEEIDATLGNEIYMYRLSTYMWHIKTSAGGAVRSIKDGRKVTAYQIVNVKEVKEYMRRAGVTSANFVPGATQKKPSISKLADLKATKQIDVEEVVQSEVIVSEATEATESTQETV